MFLDLKRVFSQEEESLPFQYEFSLSSTDFNGIFPFVSPISAKGKVENRAGAVHLDADVSFGFSMPCDRCASVIDTRYNYSFHHVLVPSLNDEDNDVYIEVENERLDLDELLRANILLELPSKYLCSPDCKGLCPKCGRNLNEGDCGCDLHQADPRLEILKQLID